MSELIAVDNFIQHPALNNLLRVLTICKGFALYFGSCNTVELRNSVVASLREKLKRPILELSLDPQNDIYISVQAEELINQADESAVLFIYGLEKLYYLKDRHVLQELQWHRERYGRLERPLVFWMPDFLITEIFHQAPDFMDWRSGIYEFHLSQPEQNLLMESTWQSVSESFVGQLTLAEKERWIVNLQNLLAELGEQENSLSKRDLLIRLGQLYYSLGKYDSALLNYQQALKNSQSINDKKGEGSVLNNISQIYDARGDYDTAFGYLQDSLKIQKKLGDKAGESATLNNLAGIAYIKADYDMALVYLKESLKISHEENNKQQESTALGNISLIYKSKGNLNDALLYLQNALKLRQEIDDKAGICNSLFNMAVIYYKTQQQQQALTIWQQAYQIAKQIGEANALENLERVAHDLGGTSLDFWENLKEV